MQEPTFEELPQEVFVAYDRSPWGELVYWVISFVVVVAMMIWLYRFMKREAAKTTIAVDITREAIEAQRETNRLLSEIIEKLDQRPL